MKLYHLSLDALNIIESFEIRVPQNNDSSENLSDKRVCLSDSIENCLNSIEWTKNQRFKDMFTEYTNYQKSIPLRVYEFEVDDKDDNLLNPNKVHKLGAFDAKVFNEYWYIGTKPLVPVKTYTIKLLNKFTVEKVKVNPSNEYIKELLKNYTCKKGKWAHRYGDFDYNLDKILDDIKEYPNKIDEILENHFSSVYIDKLLDIKYEPCSNFLIPDTSYSAFNGDISEYYFKTDRQMDLDDVKDVIYSLLTEDEVLVYGMVEVLKTSPLDFTLKTYDTCHTFIKDDFIDAFRRIGVNIIK